MQQALPWPPPPAASPCSSPGTCWTWCRTSPTPLPTSSRDGILGLRPPLPRLPPPPVAPLFAHENIVLTATRMVRRPIRRAGRSSWRSRLALVARPLAYEPPAAGAGGRRRLAGRQAPLRSSGHRPGGRRRPSPCSPFALLMAGDAMAHVAALCALRLVPGHAGEAAAPGGARQPPAPGSAGACRRRQDDRTGRASDRPADRAPRGAASCNAPRPASWVPSLSSSAPSPPWPSSLPPWRGAAVRPCTAPPPRRPGLRGLDGARRGAAAGLPGLLRQPRSSAAP